MQLGGGTDINRALAYCQAAISRPAKTHLVLITDLYEGGNGAEMLRAAGALVAAGVKSIVLLALTDQGAPGLRPDHAGAARRARLPVFACTPDLFPDLMAAALRRDDIGAWAAGADIKLVRAGTTNPAADALRRTRLGSHQKQSKTWLEQPAVLNLHAGLPLASPFA